MHSRAGSILDSQLVSSATTCRPRRTPATASANAKDSKSFVEACLCVSACEAESVATGLVG
jgi:hypothetical protein